MKIMKKTLLAAGVAGLMAVPFSSAHAWWGGGPWGGYPGSSSWMDDFFGDGFGDFNMNMNTHTSGWGRGHGYNYYAPYYAPYAYGPYGYGAPYGVAPVAPVAPVAAVTK